MISKSAYNWALCTGPHSSEIYIFLFIPVGNRRSLWQWFHRGWRRMWLWYTRGEIKLNYFLAMFPKDRQTRKHCFVDNHVFQRWKTRKQSFLTMFPEGGILANGGKLNQETWFPRHVSRRWNSSTIFWNIFQDCERVNDTCCNYTSCMLNDEAQCADGVCCSNCQVRNEYTVVCSN
jgi:hypothetical protein